MTSRSLAELTRFGIVGVIATLLYFFLFYGSASLGIPSVSAHLIASALSLAVSYLGHKLYTFKLVGNNAKHGAQFVMATALIASTQLIFIAYLDHRFELSHSVLAALGTFYFPVCSFFVHKWWTFRSA